VSLTITAADSAGPEGPTQVMAILI